MSADNAVRLAWQSHREGRTGRRDALLTLAVAEDGTPWTEPIRSFLIASRPDHFFAGFPTRERALKDARVQEAIGRLQATFPPARIRSLVRRSEVARGPFTGRQASTRLLLNDLLSSAMPRHRSRTSLVASQVIESAAPSNEPRTQSLREVPIPDAKTEPFLAFYFTTLLTIAALCAIVLQETGSENRAA